MPRCLAPNLMNGKQGQYAIIDISELGLQALTSRVALPMKIENLPDAIHDTQNKHQSSKSVTLQKTHDLFKQGLTPAKIATERNLSQRSIYNHIAKLIELDEIKLDDVIPQDITAQIIEAIKQVGQRDKLSPIKAVLPARISYEEIKCVLSSHQAQVEPESKITNEKVIPTPLSKKSIKNTDNLDQIILTIVTDLEALLSIEALINLLAASPNDIVPFSDHPHTGSFYQTKSKIEIKQSIQALIKRCQIKINKHDKLTLV